MKSRFLDGFDSEGFDGLFASRMSSHSDHDKRTVKLLIQIILVSDDGSSSDLIYVTAGKGFSVK